MKGDMNDLKKLVYDLIEHNDMNVAFDGPNARVIQNLIREKKNTTATGPEATETGSVDFKTHAARTDIQDTEEIVEESLSLADKEVEMIKKALEKYNGKRKLAANELGISERTLYRKIKEYGIE
jgi:transcriptional regulator with PAS, ATPase and Fis domain